MSNLPRKVCTTTDLTTVIADIIHDQNASFMALTEHVATLHAEIDTLKKDYVKWYQNRFQSVRDPFAPVTAAAEH